MKKQQRNAAQIKEQTRNTTFQINEEEIGKLLEKEFKIMIVKMIKTLKTAWRKCKNQLTEMYKNERINIHSQTTQLLKKILQKESGGRSQDGGGIGWGDHFLAYKFIERTIEW